MKYVVIYNESAGSHVTKKQLVVWFRKANLAIDKYIVLTNGFEAKLKAFRSTNDQVTVIAVGGDGTMSALANLLADTDTILAPLPGGTLNHFCKDIGVREDIDDAIQQLKHASVRSIDVAKVNARMFCNNAGIGLYPRSLRERDKRKRLWKWPAAIVSSLSVLVRFKSYRLVIDKRHIRTPFVFVGNNTYNTTAGSFQRDSVREGILGIVVIDAANRLQLIAATCSMLCGGRYRIREYRVKELLVESSMPRLMVSYDGEYAQFEAPLTFESCPAKLRILA